MGSHERRRIETLLEKRFGGRARVVPSARMGLIAALRGFCEPNDRAAMIAPLCEVVAFSTLAAGLRPLFVDSAVFAPVIDVEGLRSLAADRIGAVIATNLYGIPDALPAVQALCRERGWVLIEDAAQVLDSNVDGARVGTFGDATVLSFKKYFDESCGAVIVRGEDGIAAVDEFIGEYAIEPGRGARLKARAVRFARAAGLGRLESVMGRGDAVSGLPAAPTPGNTRVAAPGAELAATAEASDPFEAMDRFLALDDCTYRTFPPGAQMARLSAKLRGWDAEAQVRRESARKAEMGGGDGRVSLPRSLDPCYLAVPIKSSARDRLAAHIWREAGVRIENIYNPPLTEYLSPAVFEDARRFPERDGTWSRELLPVPTSRMEACLAAMDGFREPVGGTEWARGSERTSTRPAGAAR